MCRLPPPDRSDWTVVMAIESGLPDVNRLRSFMRSCIHTAAFFVSDFMTFNVAAGVDSTGGSAIPDYASTSRPRTLGPTGQGLVATVALRETFPRRRSCSAGNAKC